ncbi:MAG: hypothetical protein ACYS22_19060, partial [Planctomycetota bacterium]
ENGACLWVGEQRALLFIYGEKELVFARGLGSLAEPEPPIPVELAGVEVREGVELELDLGDEGEGEPEGPGLEVVPELAADAIARELVASIRHCRVLTRRGPSRIVLTGPRAEELLAPLEEATGLDLEVALKAPKNLQLPPGANSEAVARYASLMGGMAAGGTGELLPAHLRNLRGLKRAAKVWLAALLLLVAGAVVFFGQIRTVKQRVQTGLDAATQRRDDVAGRQRALSLAQAEVADLERRFKGISDALEAPRYVGQTFDALVGLSPRALAWVEVEVSDGRADGLLDVDLVVEALEAGPPELFAGRLRPLVHGALEGPTLVERPAPVKPEPAEEGAEASAPPVVEPENPAFQLARYRLQFTVDATFWRGVVGQRKLDGSLGEQR